LIDVTVVNVAVPTVGRSLHASGAELQLVVAGYTVSYAMMLITGARMGDLCGRRRMFMTGVLVFTLASLACGIAPGIGILIAARFVQGAGAAAMMPQIMSVIQVRFDGAARAWALSAYTAVLSSGFVAGQVVGGVLVTANLFGREWRPVFLVNVPIGLAVLALVALVVPADVPARGRRLDLVGLAIAVPAVFLIVLPLMLGHQENWQAWVFACIGLGLVLAAVFVLIERRIADRGGDPLLNLAVLRAPGLMAGLAAVAVLMITYGGFLFSFALHLQAGLGDSALRAGLTFAPCAVVFGMCGYFWRRLPSGLHHLLAPAGCLVAVGGYVGVALALRSGGHGGLLAAAWRVAIRSLFGAGVAVPPPLVEVGQGHGVAGGDAEDAETVVSPGEVVLARRADAGVAADRLGSLPVAALAVARRAVAERHALRQARERGLHRGLGPVVRVGDQAAAAEFGRLAGHLGVGARRDPGRGHRDRLAGAGEGGGHMGEQLPRGGARVAR